MQTAARVRPTVGVAPGTTTFQLTGPTMATATVTACDDTPERVFWQRKRLWPAGKYRVAPPTVAAMAVGGGNRQILDPYASIEALKGPPSGIRRKATQAMAVVKQSLGRLGQGLGLVVAPYGDRSPQPSVEMTAAGRNMWPTCRGGRSTKPNDYQGTHTSAYMHDGGIGLDNMGLAGPSASFIAAGQPSYGGTYTSDGPSSMPTDTQLAPMRTYTPIIQQFVPFKAGNWPAPWRPPGGPVMLAGPQVRLLGTAEGDGDAPATPVDPARATLDALIAHQDKMYGIAMLSAAAVASTALINVFRYSNERRESRKRRGTKVAAEPAAMISGTRRRRKR